MKHEQKAVAILRAIATQAAQGKSLTIANDWGFGSATLIVDGSHTHIGSDTGMSDGEVLSMSIEDQQRFKTNEERNFAAFVDDFYAVVVKERGLKEI